MKKALSNLLFPIIVEAIIILLKLLVAKKDWEPTLEKTIMDVVDVLEEFDLDLIDKD